MQKAPLHIALTHPEQQEALAKLKSLDFADIQTNEAVFWQGITAGGSSSCCFSCFLPGLYLPGSHASCGPV